VIANFNSGLGSGYTYLWEFGDGQSSTDEQPIHDYLYAGTYEVRLTVTNDFGDYVFTQPVTIASEFSIDLPVASFTADAQSGASPLAVVFTDTSTGDISSWEWYVNDVLESSVQAFSHTFTDDGTYTVKLKINGAGEAIATMVVIAGSLASLPPIITELGATKTSSITGELATTFSATINGDVTGYLWEFGDGYTSTDDNPVHTFSNIGTYTVSLTVTNLNGPTTSTIDIRVVDAGSFTGMNQDAYINGVKIGFYVVDAVDHTVRVYKSETEPITNFGSIGNGDGQFNNPTSIAIVGANKLLDRVEL
jgi:PKD repeat protein